MASKMRAVQSLEAGKYELVNIDLPDPRPGEALIRVLRAGICNTDLEILKGYMDFKGTLGHEFVGTVVKVNGEKGQDLLGQRIVGEINLCCGSCEVCDLGGFHKRNHCARRSVLGILNKNGTFAEFLTLPVENLFLVPEDVSDVEAAFAEPLAAAFRIVEQMDFKTSDSVAIIGDGKLGLLITEVMAIQNVQRVVLFGHHVNKMALVPSNVEKVISTQDTGTKFGNSFDITIEASGTPSGVMMGATLAKPLSKLVLKTTCAASSVDFNTAPFVIKELVIIGSRCGNFQMALDALKSKKISTKKYLDKEYDLGNAKEAIERAGQKGTLKVQIVF